MLTDEVKKKLMREALDEARRGMARGEVPIGCVIARGDGGSVEIVARGYNRVNALQRKVAHAEMIAFENASALTQTGKPPLPLDAADGILVSTLEPCVMCLGAAMEAGMKTVIYALRAPADCGTRRVRPPESPESSTPEIVGGVLERESRELMEIWLSDHADSEQAKFVKQLLALTEKT